MPELQQALILANKILDRINADPDDDLAILARQLIRQHELTDKYKWQVRDTCARAEQAEEAIKQALRHLDYATPNQRNGPVYRAADILRAKLKLPPMTIGGKPSEGLKPL